MKMVSQLTRQAMQRHRLIAAGMASAAFPAPTIVPKPVLEEPTGFQMLHPLYSSAPSLPQSSPPNQPVPPPPPRPHTVYQQLMSSHDRMGERHLRHT